MPDSHHKENAFDFESFFQRENIYLHLFISSIVKTQCLVKRSCVEVGIQYSKITVFTCSQTIRKAYVYYCYSLFVYLSSFVMHKVSTLRINLRYQVIYDKDNAYSIWRSCSELKLVTLRKDLWAKTLTLLFVIIFLMINWSSINSLLRVSRLITSVKNLEYGFSYAQMVANVRINYINNINTPSLYNYFKIIIQKLLIKIWFTYEINVNPNELSDTIKISIKLYIVDLLHDR